MYDLTKHEELILLSILKLSGNAYIVSIRAHIKDITGKSINYGSLCNTLSTLIRKEFIDSRESAPVPRQGGRRKILYSLTNEGKTALKQAFEIQQLVWSGMADLVNKFE